MKVTIHAAKTNLSRLIEQAHGGEEIIIARGDVPVARLVPIIEQLPKRQPGTLRGVVEVTEAFFEPLPPEEIDAFAWEIATKVRLGKLSWPDTAGSVQAYAHGQGFRALPITLDHAQRAGQLRIAHRDPFDRMLIAQRKRRTCCSSATRPSLM
jgi:antitoxin (DNA-binding transcriptional repressor) of toxin-antitoxin stability system